jgi:hypothetical protein
LDADQWVPNICACFCSYACLSLFALQVEACTNHQVPVWEYINLLAPEFGI